MSDTAKQLVEYLEQREYLISECLKRGEPAHNWVTLCSHSYLAHGEILRSLNEFALVHERLDEIQKTLDFICYKLENKNEGEIL